MLRWGLNKAADTCRLLRVGLTFGALMLARAQLERWTLNVVAHHKVAAMTDTESAADYIRRVWSRPSRERRGYRPAAPVRGAGSHSRPVGMSCWVAACRSTAGRKIPFGTLDRPIVRRFGLLSQRRLIA
jgi:hypothetical protein